MDNLTTQSLNQRQRRDNRAWTVRVLFSGDQVSDPSPRSLPIGETSIGRGTTGAKGLCYEDDPAMSRRHATIERTLAGLTLRNHSRNGSWVNGERTEGAPLADCDIIRCGDTFALIRLEPVNPDDAEIHGILGVSALAQQVRGAIAQVATTDATVVLQGETGTGKRLAARAIHELSGRSGPWLQLNCAAIPEALAESSLFGHANGAVTGANTNQPGYFIDADGGTLFIDEIGDLDAKLQPKLLNALDHRQATPVGGTRPIPFDTRLVTATRKELNSEVTEGRFRADLYARLATVVISMPPLRDRIEDMLVVLLDRLGGEPKLSADLVDALLQYHWPYNFREVESIAIELSVKGAGYDELVVELIEERLQSADQRPARSMASHQPPPQRPGS